jgi:hypothetical protein
VRKVYPFPFHQVSEIGIFYTAFTQGHAYIPLCILHGSVVLFCFSIHRGCATLLSCCNIWLLGGLIFCCLVLDFWNFFQVPFFCFPFVCLVPSFHHVPGLLGISCRGFIFLFICSVPRIWGYKPFLVLLCFGIYHFLPFF